MSTDPLVGIDWPQNPTMEALAEAVGKACGLRVVLEPIPPQLQHPEVSGLTVLVGPTAHVYYDAGLSPINRVVTVCHEFAHVLHGDVGADGSAAYHRTTFDDPRERRAEMTGMRLMFEARRRSKKPDMLDFFSGGSGAA
jgi:hypothetical protein